MSDLRTSLRRQSLLVAFLCVACDVGALVLICPRALGAWPGWVAVAATVAADAALAGVARRSGLVAVGHAALQVVGPLLLAGFGGYQGTNEVGLLVAAYRAGAWLDRPQALAVLAVLLVGTGVGQWLDVLRVDRLPLIALGALGSALLPWLVGRNTTARRGYIAELEQREAGRLAEERAAVRRAVAEERTAIARDLHDVISHHVSAIGIHAGAARMALPGAEGTAVRRSLSAVEAASRSAMDDLRRMLDLLHNREDGAIRQPGLDDLDELLDRTRAAGLPIRLTTVGEAAGVPGSVNVALYRIAQEALTNALRHGAGGTADVELRHADGAVALSVVNDLPARPRPDGVGARRGLAGVRKRAALFGGEVTCGPTPDGGRWAVHVTIPLRPGEHP